MFLSGANGASVVGDAVVAGLVKFCPSLPVKHQPTTVLFPLFHDNLASCPLKILLSDRMAPTLAIYVVLHSRIHVRTRAACVESSCFRLLVRSRSAGFYAASTK